MAYRTIGNTVAEWDDREPLIFIMSEESGSKEDRRLKTVRFDLNGLRAGFEEEFLLNFKNVLIERRQRIALISIRSEYENIVMVFRSVVDHKLFDTRISIVDEAFLLALSTIKEKVPSYYLDNLRRVFNSNQHAPIFALGLRQEDFPVKSIKKGNYGNKIDSIISKAFTRSATVEMLRRCDEAYEDGELDIGLFSFINLAFSVYARSDSYRRIRLNDLVCNTTSDTYFLYIPPAKARVNNPQKICYRVSRQVGMLLLKQRQEVIETFGHLVVKNDVDKLALFPARGLKRGKSAWRSEHSNKFFGELELGHRFNREYFTIVRDKVLNSNQYLTATALRHTVGTQMAVAGCSAKSIQAVLKQVSDQTCMAYVDIAFHGLINELNGVMQPSFESHMPVFQRFRSKDDLVAQDKAIFSEDIETGRFELTGECGKQIRCHAAPFSCYECNKFIPCFDTDHSLNMDIIEREIEIYKRAGTPFRHQVEKMKTIKYHIQLVMAACDCQNQAIVEQKV